MVSYHKYCSEFIYLVNYIQFYVFVAYPDMFHSFFGLNVLNEETKEEEKVY